MSLLYNVNWYTVKCDTCLCFKSCWYSLKEVHLCTCTVCFQNAITVFLLSIKQVFCYIICVFVLEIKCLNCITVWTKAIKKYVTRISNFNASFYQHILHVSPMYFYKDKKYKQKSHDIIEMHVGIVYFTQYLCLSRKNVNLSWGLLVENYPNLHPTRYY